MDVAERAHLGDGRRAGGVRAGDRAARRHEARGKAWSKEDEEAFKAPIREQYETQGHPYYATRAAVGRRRDRPGADAARARARACPRRSSARSRRRSSACSGCSRDVQEDPHRQPRRDRLPRHQDRAPHGHAHRRRVLRGRRQCAARRGSPTRPCSSGPPPARESYLASTRIIDAAQADGRAGDPSRLRLPVRERGRSRRPATRAGIVFIGPPASAIRAMGCKSRGQGADGEGAGVPLVPGYHGDDQDAGAAADGGRPHRLSGADQGRPPAAAARACASSSAPSEFAAALASCKREARRASATTGCCIEKYVTRPRHIEIQVFADTHGNCVHLFERDCSVQRRHQKVLEEAPAPGMTAARRRAMGEAAVAAARAVGYVGAGTVEFIADQDGALLLHGDEHAPAGRASGHRDDHRTRPGRMAAARRGRRAAAADAGAAARSAATRSRRASTPRIRTAASCRRPAGSCTSRRPPESLHVRVDTGVEQGDEITPYYDPMIAKLIVWDETRELALARMLQALAQYRIVGVANNVEFLARLVACAVVRASRPRHRPDRARARVPVSRPRDAPGRCVARRGARDAAARGRGGAAQAARERRSAFAVAARATAGGSTARLRAHARVPYGERERDVAVGYAATAAITLDAGGTSTLPRAARSAPTARCAPISAAQRIARTVVAHGEQLPRVPRRHAAIAARCVDPLAPRRRGPGRRGRPRRADARQGHRVAGASRRRGREGRAAADPRGDEDGAHDHRAARRHGQAIRFARRRPGHRRRRAGRLRAERSPRMCHRASHASSKSVRATACRTRRRRSRPRSRSS